MYLKFICTLSHCSYLLSVVIKLKAHYMFMSLHLICVFLDWREHNCFTCMDEDGCLKIERIFGPDDHLLFERDLKDKIPNCSAVLPLANTCSVCCSKSKIHIYCPKNIKTFDAEKDGEKIYNISIGCKFGFKNTDFK